MWKIKPLSVFCLTISIISLGVLALILAQYLRPDITLPAYDPDNDYVASVLEETKSEVLNSVYEYEEVPLQLHYTYTEIVAPIYDSVRSFHNGYAVVGMGSVWNDEMLYRERGSYGLIDREGNLILPIIYDSINTIIIDDCVVAIVTYDGKRGILDVNGNEILPLIYTRVSIRDNFAVVTYGIGDDRASGLLNLSTGEFAIPKGQYVAVSDLISEGRTWVTLGPENRWRWGLVDIDSGQLLTSMIYAGSGLSSPPGSFRNGVVLAYRDVGVGRKAGLLDINGNEITAFIYDDAFISWGDFVGVSYDGRWGSIDTEGNYIIEPMFDSRIQLSARGGDFWYSIVRFDGFVGVWDVIEGRLVATDIYHEVFRLYSNLVIVRYGEWPDISEGVINIETGEHVIPLGYMHFGNNSIRNGLILASKGNWGSDYRMGIIDIRTGEIVADFIYDDLRWEYGVERDYIIFINDAEWELRNWDGYEFYALLGGLYGIMDSCGNVIVPAIYSFIHYMHESSDLFVVALSCEQNGTKMGVINGSGEVVLPIEYTHIGSFWRSSGLHTNFAPVNIGAEWVWNPGADSYDGFGGGYELMGGKWGFIDANGNLVVPVELEYDLVNPVIDGMAAVMRDGKWGFIAVRPG